MQIFPGNTFAKVISYNEKTQPSMLNPATNGRFISFLQDVLFELYFPRCSHFREYFGGKIYLENVSNTFLVSHVFNLYQSFSLLTN